jgi:hypothetical protein
MSDYVCPYRARIRELTDLANGYRNTASLKKTKYQQKFWVAKAEECEKAADQLSAQIIDPQV